MSEAELKAQPANPEVDEGAEEAAGGGIVDRLRAWMFSDSPWWLVSAALHCFIFLTLALIPAGAPLKTEGEAPSFDEAKLDQQETPAELERFEVGETPEEPTELTTDTLTLNEAPAVEQDEKYYDNNSTFIEAGGGMAVAVASNVPVGFGAGGFEIKGIGPGPMVRGGGGIGVGVGTGKNAGSGGGDGYGFGGRGQGSRKAMVGGYGGTKQSERAVAGALNWIARHQLPDGRWSLSKYQTVCKDPTCTGPGVENADTGATAMGLLPYLAAGQTHQSKGPYRTTITNGLAWLMRNQKPDGDLRGTSSMYSHGLAAITLCEAYGLTGDRAVGYAAQAAINFIQKAQNQKTGGWRYTPGDEGDTSVVGWQLMALKSGIMAGLQVDPKAVAGVKGWLKSVGTDYGGKYAYTPGSGATPTMSAVGLLCNQYLGAKKDDAGMTKGLEYLMANTPDKGRNIYYDYYATQVVHNFTGPEWDTWNRITRRKLIDQQNKERDQCATGSWDPAKPTADAWGTQGGRLMMTSLGALTLEVYYRYLPLYKLDKEEEAKAKAPLDAPADKKA
ncbi:MAG: terpene cyclase/mutase family protein [Planctomycetota bacterium]|nr:terpene cyclase/mutase family protein [Planctomycetota bacterium]